MSRTYSTWDHMHEDNQHRATRAPLQHLLEYIIGNFKSTTWRDHNTRHDQNASRTETTGKEFLSGKRITTRKIIEMIAKGWEQHHPAPDNSEVPICVSSTHWAHFRLPPSWGGNLVEAHCEWYWNSGCHHIKQSSTRSCRHSSTVASFPQSHIEVREHIPARQLEKVCGISWN